jgi:integrase
MATVKYRLKSNAKKENTIYVYLSIGRGKLFEVKSGFFIDANDWQIKSGFPKQTTQENKNLSTDLKDLESYILKSVNIANSKGELIDKYWLERKIKDCFNRVEKTDSDVFVNHLQYIINNAHNRKISGKNSLGLSESRIKGYKTFLRIIMEFQQSKGKTVRFSEINNMFVEEFKNWLLKNKSYSVGYAGKQIDNLKAVCNDAERLGVSTVTNAKNIESFTESDEDRYIVTLSFEEIQSLYNTLMPNNYLENTKNWMLIGFELGQRGEDLLNVTQNSIRYIDDLLTVDVHQQKTKKDVSVVIMKPETVEILENKIPHKISLQKFNKYIKEVCEIAKLNELTEGYKLVVNESKQRRKVFGKYPKWELMASHSLRRSFATNYYKLISTPVLMGITGHARETDFLKYINRQVDKDDNAKLFAMQYNQSIVSRSEKSV